MTDNLTLPGSIPGLLRRGSPVLVAPEAATPRRGVVVDFAHKPAGAMALDDYLVARGAKMPRNWMASNLLLDLTDATGRTHAAWWLEGQVNSIGSDIKRQHSTGGRAFWMMGGVAFHCLDDIMWRCLDAIRVPALATLDPNDPRLLPDGSRWVDAEALRLVCLHVAGLEVTR